VIPFFLEQKKKGMLTITDERMTRFMITLEEAVHTVWHAFDDMVGGEIYIKKIPSIKIVDIARVISPDLEYQVIGIRPGEKLHEQMIGIEDSMYTYEYQNYYKVLPAIHNWSRDQMRIGSGKKVTEDFTYSSEANSDWMQKDFLTNWLKINRNKFEI
jgi:FlaA1/EpsC-like NDP-sugar epimerase